MMVEDRGRMVVEDRGREDGDGGRGREDDGGGQREGGWWWRTEEMESIVNPRTTVFHPPPPPPPPPPHPQHTHTHTLKDNAVGSYGHSLSMVALA